MPVVVEDLPHPGRRTPMIDDMRYVESECTQGLAILKFLRRATCVCICVYVYTVCAYVCMYVCAC